MKQLSSFMVFYVDGGTRVSFTYSEIDPDTGELISQNNKKTFFVVDDGLKTDIESIENFIKENKF